MPPTTGESLTDVRGGGSADRVVTIPNALSVLRLLGVPLFLWLLLGPEADIAALVVLMVAGATDYFDGKIARWLGQTSKLGVLLDPAADRLYILATLFAFVVRDIIPWWLAALIVGRDLLLAPTLPLLRRHGYGPLQVQLPRQGGDLQPAVRVPAAADRRARLAGLGPGPPGRLGVRDLGDRAVPLLRRPLPDPGRPARPRGPAGRVKGEHSGRERAGNPLVQRALVLSRGGRTRHRPRLGAMSTSLLDELMTDHLDAGYAAAARRRAEAGGAGRRAAARPGGRSRSGCCSSASCWRSRTGGRCGRRRTRSAPGRRWPGTSSRVPR